MLIGLFVVVYAAIAWLMNCDWIGALVFSAMIVAPDHHPDRPDADGAREAENLRDFHPELLRDLLLGHV